MKCWPWQHRWTLHLAEQKYLESHGKPYEAERKPGGRTTAIYHWICGVCGTESIEHRLI